MAHVYESIFFSIALAMVLNLSIITRTWAQSPSASPVAPAPAGPDNITAVLEKAGQYSTLIRLLRSTGVEAQINQQLNTSNQGLTVFAPPDSAFATLKSGTLNALTDSQKVQLVQFHVLPTSVSIPQFQTVSNPVRTNAGSTDVGRFPLNIVTNGSQVNITTGIVNATIANTIFTDNQLAVYQVDKVLLPLDIFGPHVPAPAPAPEKTKKKSAKALAPKSDEGTADTSGVVEVERPVVVTFVVAAAVAFWL